ncbi:hypothetical protein Vafri_15921, partial [Volvox africanus]
PAEGFHGRHAVAPTLQLGPPRARSFRRLDSNNGLLGWTAHVLAQQHSPPLATALPTSTTTGHAVKPPDHLAKGGLAHEVSLPSMTTPEGNRYPGAGTSFTKD